MTTSPAARLPWWKTGVVYQIYPRSFMDASGDGVGDLQGILDRLDYLNGREDSLGVDAIWLSPIHPSPGKDFGYDVADYRDIDPLFGDLDTFRRLLEAAHARGIRVLLDLVVNHTSDRHPWFKQSRSSRSNPRRDWYIWRDGRGGKPPNNWVSTFGGPAWTLDEVTGQYYLHSFLPEQPDLNWRNPEVQQAVFEMMRYWLDMGVDGFRLDVYNAYVKDAELRDNPRKLSGIGLFYGYLGQRHLYDRDQPELVDVLRRMREVVDAYPDRYLVGETMAEADWSRAAEGYGRNDDGLHATFNFELLHAAWKPEEIRRAILNWVSSLPAWAWPTWVLSNHDWPRHLTRYTAPGDPVARARAAAALLLCLRGTPFVYYGEELGLPEASLTRAQIQDPPGRRFWPVYKGRDGCRTPMQWNAGPNAGFSTATPWLPVGRDAATLHVEAARQDPDSLWNVYHRLLRLRRARPALHRGAFQMMATEDPAVLAWRRVAWPAGAEDDETRPAGTVPDDQVLVLVNLSNEVTRFQLQNAPGLRVLFSTHRDVDGPLRNGTVWLFPYEALVAGTTP